MKQFTKFFCILVIVGANVVSSNDVQSILSKLYKRAVQTNRPLVVVLDNANGESRGNSQSNRLGGIGSSGLSKSLSSYVPYSRPEQSHSHSVHHPRSQNRFRDRSQNRISPQSNRQDSSESSALQILYLLKELQVRESLEKQRMRQKTVLRGQDQQQLVPHQILPAPVLAPAPVLPLQAPSPIVKHLLRLRNSLRCGQKAECENMCEKKVTKKYICTKKCAEKYTCTEAEPEPEPEPEEPEEECEIGDDCESACDSCQDTRTYSTKALEVGKQQNNK